MQIRKTYSGVNPELVYDEVRDFILKQSVRISEQKLETSALPGDSSSFMSRGTMTFAAKDGAGVVSIRAHIVGSIKTETKMILDIDERLFPPDKIASLQQDIDFIFSSYEVK
ncbi:MAG: hypothetical protein Q7R57_00300 [Dehalococcoidales bacterium]|nr:hypothetical protein [Dehalococcoidales bacterium]